MSNNISVIKQASKMPDTPVSGIPVIMVFDAGKTNKKVLLFDQHYQVVYEESRSLEETVDEDGFACEDVHALTQWVKESYERMLQDARFDVKAVNFSAYGASFVYLDAEGNVLPPLYNYLKPLDKNLQDAFYKKYGGESLVAKQTASPVLGLLNSGMQIYRLKYERPEFYQQVKYALHLPQYLSFILSGKNCTDITSIGCHTNLWDFQQLNYHRWVVEEGIASLLPPIVNGDALNGTTAEGVLVGTGLHDSSSALIPYFAAFHEPFMLLSTGTWCISLNPFNHASLSDFELSQDCLCYLSYKGKPVKASRLFAGYEHEVQTKRLAAHFNVAEDFYKTVACDPLLIEKLQRHVVYDQKVTQGMVQASVFGSRDLKQYANYEEAYHQLILDIMAQQVRSTQLVLNQSPVKRIFVDGGFSKNPIYMLLLAQAFPQIEVYAATVAQASSLGAALAIHQHWNPLPLPSDCIGLKYYAVQH